MRRSRLFILILIILTTLIAAGCSPEIRTDRDTLFQTSTISALMNGVYDGNMTVGQLRPYGDFGLGTFQALTFLCTQAHLPNPAGLSETFVGDVPGAER